MLSKLFIVALAVLCLAACGTPGAPRPPSLRLPETVSDLAATRQGSTVTLSWTEPARTTDGENIRALGPTLICIGVNAFPMTRCEQVVADLSQSQFASCNPEVGKPVTCAVTLSSQLQQQNPSALATYAIEVMNASGRSAGLSNQVPVSLAWTPPAANDVIAKVSADGIEINWNGGPVGARKPGEITEYHVFRREGSGPEIDLGASHTAGAILCFRGCEYRYLDKSFEWEKTYIYRIIGITTVQFNGKEAAIQGAASPTATVTAHDIFPPAVPTGVQAVASGVGQQPFIDLTWAPNTESDLAGYNVYRHEEGQPALKVNSELVKAPAYRDANVQRGHKHFYSVTAVDLRGNESGKSAEATEVVQ